MAVVEEKNPLQFHTEVSVTRVTLNYKNNVGRPSKKSEIKFSPQPKSIISILLSKEKTKTEDRKILINKIIKKPKKRKESTHEDSSEGSSCSKIDERNVLQRNQHYDCNYFNCTYSSKFLSNLKTHKKVHTSEQPYICEKCAFRSKYISSLNAHKLIHRAEKPFACLYCEYKCNSRSNLKKHTACKHKIKIMIN